MSSSAPLESLAFGGKIIIFIKRASIHVAFLRALVPTAGRHHDGPDSTSASKWPLSIPLADRIIN